MQRFSSAAAAAITLALLTGCGGEQGIDVCANNDGALNNVGFIFVQEPRSGGAGMEWLPGQRLL